MARSRGLGDVYKRQELWNESFNKPKPLYMVWHDIMNY
jgi:hypothetical protein